MEDSNPVIHYSIIAGDFEGDGNIDKDPLFADKDFRLSAESPSIDAGANKAVPVRLITDIDGSKRIIRAAVDLGAYEYK